MFRAGRSRDWPVIDHGCEGRIRLGGCEIVDRLSGSVRAEADWRRTEGELIVGLAISVGRLRRFFANGLGMEVCEPGFLFSQ